MNKIKPGYDPKCEDLARHFLPYADDAEVADMAQVIQDAIEDQLEDPR